MKYISKIALGLGVCVSLFSSCKDDEGPDTNRGISLDKEEISIGPDGGTESISVSSGMEWVSSASKPWISVSPANGFGSVEGALAIDSTLEWTARNAQVRFRQSDNQEKIVNITQFGYGKQIIPSKKELEVKNSDLYDNRYFDLTISTNVEFKVDKNIIYEWEGELTPEDQEAFGSEVAGWIETPDKTEVELDRKDRPRTVKIRFRWSMNTAPHKRVAKIRLLPKDENVELIDQDGNPTEDVIVKVVQEAAVRITDDRQGDSLAVVMMNEKIQSLFSYNFTDRMENWDNVTLWEEGDKDMPDGALGRIRALSFMMFNLKEGETLPKEIKYLKYLEEFSFTSNTNHQIKKMDLGEDICELQHLKRLAIEAYGLTKLPEGFNKLGKKLEYLDIGSNGFPKLSTVTDVVNKTNFPKLKGLSLSGCRRNDTTTDLAAADGLTNGELGIYLNLGEADSRGDVFWNSGEPKAFMDLLKWDDLEYLGLSYMFIEGELPTDEEMMNNLDAAKKNYVDDDFYIGKDNYDYGLIPRDTCSWLLEGEPVMLNDVNVEPKDIPRVLPKAHYFSINLNFITGELPKWILFHPYFMEWTPESLIFNQWEKGKDSKGNSVGFGNAVDIVNSKFKYYYGDKATGNGSAYPLYYNKYAGGRAEQNDNQ